MIKHIAISIFLILFAGSCWGLCSPLSWLIPTIIFFGLVLLPRLFHGFLIIYNYGGNVWLKI